METTAESLSECDQLHIFGGELQKLQAKPGRVEF